MERIEQPADRVLDTASREYCAVGLHLAGRALPLPAVGQLFDLESIGYGVSTTFTQSSSLCLKIW